MQPKIEETKIGRFLSFGINTVLYGIKVDAVLEILTYQLCTPLPNQANFICGVINLRGKIIPVIDLGVTLNNSSCNEKNSCLIVVQFSNYVVGLIVDEVNEVLEIPIHLIEKSNTSEKLAHVEGIANLPEIAPIILNLEILLHPDARKKFCA